MSDKRPSDLPLDSEDAAERELWKALGQAPAQDPSPHLRREFYRNLETAGRPALTTRLRHFLGFSDNTGWLTATACVLLGLGAGQLANNTTNDKDIRLATLEENVSLLNRSLILDRLENDRAGKRLRGVIDAAHVVGDDAEVARALLERATEDRIPSVRSAAIDALGPQINKPAIGDTVMNSILKTDSPLVQLALIDLVLRNGSQDHLDELLRLAESNRLFPDISRHVLTSLKGDLT